MHPKLFENVADVVEEDNDNDEEEEDEQYYTNIESSNAWSSSRSILAREMFDH